MRYIFDNFITAFGIRQLMVLMSWSCSIVASSLGLYINLCPDARLPGPLLGILFAAGAASGSTSRM